MNRNCCEEREEWNMTGAYDLLNMTNSIELVSPTFIHRTQIIGKGP